MKNHFEYGVNLLKSKLDYNIMDDLYFVFSNEQQKDKFQSLIKAELLDEELHWLILPNELDKYKAKVNVKKLYGLHELMNKYEYIILLDCETKFIKNGNFSDIAKKIWETKNMFNANKSPDGFLS